MRKLSLFLVVLLPLLLLGGVTIKRGPSRSSGGGIGITGTTGNDDTLGYLKRLSQFQSIDRAQLRTQIWIDPYMGDDTTGTGTYTLPYRSIEKAKLLALPYTRFTFKGRSQLDPKQGRVFAPLTLAMDATTFAVGESEWRIGETVSWDTAGAGVCDAAACFGTLLDAYFEGATIIFVIDRDSVGATIDPVAADVLTGTNPTRTVTITSVTNTINLSAGTTADNAIAPDCDDRDRICILFESEFPDAPTIIDGNRFGALGNTTIDDCALFGVLADPSKGWVGIQNVIMQNYAGDAFSICASGSAAGKMVLLNTGARDIRNGSENRQGAGASNNCYTTHSTGGAMIILNSRQSESRVDSAGGAGSCLAPTQKPKFTIIGGGPFTSQSVAANHSGALTQGNSSADVAIIDTHMLGSATQVNNGMIFSVADAAGSRVQIARTLVQGRVNNLFVVGLSYTAATAGSHAISMYDSTFGGSNARWMFLSATVPVSLFGRGLVIDNAEYWIVAGSDASITNTTPDLQGIFDDDDAINGADEWLITAPAYSTRALFLAAAAVLNPAWTDAAVFGTNSADSGTAGIDGTQWGTDTVHFRCSSARECWQARIGENDYTIDLRSMYDSGVSRDDACIPADVVGSKICAFQLRPVHMGAR